MSHAGIPVAIVSSLANFSTFHPFKDSTREIRGASLAIWPNFSPLYKNRLSLTVIYQRRLSVFDLGCPIMMGGDRDASSKVGQLKLHEILRNYKPFVMCANFVASNKQRFFLAGCLRRLSHECPILPPDRWPTLCVSIWVILRFFPSRIRGLGEVGSSGSFQPGQLLQSLPSTSQ